MGLAFLGGALLGSIFFSGLYWSIKKMNSFKQPGIFMSLSMFVRMAVLVLGLYFISNEQITNFISALAGILTARTLIVRAVSKERR